MILDHYEHGNWGTVMYTPGKWPEWSQTPRWSEATAKAIAADRTAMQQRATILRHPPGTRWFAVQDGTPFHVHRQLTRIVESRS